MPDAQYFQIDALPLQCGLTLPRARLAYQTYGELNAARDNVILMPTFFGSQTADAEAAISAWPALDPAKYFIVVPNLFGNGLSSSPSNTPAPFDGPLFPNVTIYDNVVAQHRLLTEHLGVRRIRLVVGFSMGAQQAYQWAASYPDIVDAIAPICGSARTSPHNHLFLEGIKAALTADGAFAEGWYQTPPVKGLRAFSRVYMGWAFSQDFFREQAWRHMGLASQEDSIRFLEGYFRQRDANDLLTLVSTWQNADISANERYRRDFASALQAIRARALVMPSQTDLYFRVRDSELEVEQIPNAKLHPIPSIWGHVAGLAVNPQDNAFINQALSELLA